MTSRAKPTLYRNVAQTAWTGETARAVKRRGGAEGLLVMQYLMTGPYTTMLGVYRLVVGYMGAETALGDAGATKGLRACIDADFCSYDEESEFVFVHQFAKWQIGAELASADKRCKGVQTAYEALPDNPFLGAFFDRYAHAFHMTRRREPRAGDAPPSDLFGPVRVSPSEAPSKPGSDTRYQDQIPGSGTGAGQGQHVGAESPPPAPPPAPAAAAPATTRGTRLTAAWKLPKAWGDWALDEFAQWSADKVRLEGEKFRDHWVAKTGKDATKTDWLATWRNWCRSPIAHRDDPKLPAAAPPPEDRAARHAEVRAALGLPTDDEQEIIDAAR